MLKRNPPHFIGRKRNTRYTRYILASLQPPVNMSDDHPSVTQGILLEGLRNTRSKEFSVANTRSRNFGSMNFGSNGILGRREFSVEEFSVEGNFGSNKNYQEILRNQSLVFLMIKYCHVIEI